MKTEIQVIHEANRQAELLPKRIRECDYCLPPCLFAGCLSALVVALAFGMYLFLRGTFTH